LSDITHYGVNFVFAVDRRIKEKNVVAALMEEKGRFLLCQRKEGDSFGGLWEFPGGTVEEGESLSQAIEREIKEEINVDVAASDVLQEFTDENEHLRIKVFLIRCSIRSYNFKTNDCENFGFFSLKEIERLELAPVDKKIFCYLREMQG
jgi:8-oxo-dGTP diphosphatase